MSKMRRHTITSGANASPRTKSTLTIKCLSSKLYRLVKSLAATSWATLALSQSATMITPSISATCGTSITPLISNSPMMLVHADIPPTIPLPHVLPTE